MKKILTLLILVCLPDLIYSQENGIKTEILSMEDSKQDLITKGRRLLLERLVANDLAKVAEIKTYLEKEVANDQFLAFYPFEKSLLDYYTTDFGEIMRITRMLEPEEIEAYQSTIKPTEDQLGRKLLEKSRNERNVLLELIKTAPDLSPMDKDFLSLNLLYLLEGPNYREITQEELNYLSDKFLANYPASIHEPYIREYVRMVFKPSKWGLGVEFFSGYGRYTGQLEEEFKSSIPMGIAFDVTYLNWVLFLRNYIGFTKNKHDISYGAGIWPRESQARMFLPEITLGYQVLKSEHFILTPFAGMGWTDIGPTTFDMEKNPDLRNATLTFTQTPTVGVNLDLIMGRINTPMIAVNEQNYWMIRLRYAHHAPRYDKKYTGFDGNIHSITVGVGGFGRSLKKSY
jgi:hypothetical protein